MVWKGVHFSQEYRVWEKNMSFGEYVSDIHEFKLKIFLLVC